MLEEPFLELEFEVGGSVMFLVIKYVVCLVKFRLKNEHPRGGVIWMWRRKCTKKVGLFMDGEK